MLSWFTSFVRFVDACVLLLSCTVSARLFGLHCGEVVIKDTSSLSPQTAFGTVMCLEFELSESYTGCSLCQQVFSQLMYLRPGSAMSAVIVLANALPQLQ